MCVPGRYRLPRSLSTSAGVVAIGKGARDDAFDDLALRVGVVLDVGPFASGKFALGVLVANSLVVMRAKAIADLEALLRAEGVEPTPTVVAHLRTRLEE